MPFLGFRIGFPDHTKPYEITALQTNTTADPLQGPNFGRVYEFTTTVQISIFVKRLNRDNVDPQLGNMEREVQQVICQYKSGDISKVRDIIYEGQERIYNANDSYAKSEWRTVVTVSVKYEIQNPDLGP